jgi:DNA (cytosine-5)-methyltransferase 1
LNVLATNSTKNIEVDNNLLGYKYIDLFAGIGGFHLALSSFKAECVFASEWDDSAAKVYERNFGIKPFGDITKIHENTIPKHDILCGGFPCQAFSVSGKQKGFEDTRGTLFFDIARIIKYHKPKILFLENVKNLEKHDNGKTLKVIISTLIDLGYDVFYKVLNASDYGLPQNRERIFIVCFRNDLNINNFDFPKPIKKQISLFDILEDNPKAKIITRNDIKINKDFNPNINIFGETELPNKPIQIGIVNKGGQGERIYSPHGHACTLSAYGGGAGSKTGIYYVNGILRKLSTRECARVQGFPDDFVIDENQGQAYKQFGNSVAVSVLKEILKQIIKVVKNGL